MTQEGMEAFERVRACARMMKLIERQSERTEDENTKAYLKRWLAKEKLVLEEKEKKARPFLEELKPDLYAFAAAYYFEGMTMPEVSAALDRSERQCERYKAELKTTADEK